MTKRRMTPEEQAAQLRAVRKTTKLIFIGIGERLVKRAKDTGKQIDEVLEEIRAMDDDELVEIFRAE
jgi:hypothetical protein